eukprot:14232091-Ditylum_brightwellii.AAC.1
MLKQPDKDEFAGAMYTEVKHMLDNQVWEKVPRQEMLDYHAMLKKLGISVKRKQLMLIWSFKRKRHAGGSLAKYKARLCCHGGQQQWGVNFYAPYAYVVSWAAARTMMIMSKLHNLHTRSIAFVLASPQAEVKSIIYLHPSAGTILKTNEENAALTIRKNLYGLKDAGRT